MLKFSMPPHLVLCASWSSVLPGAVPDPVHLSEVQSCLTRIQKILLQLKSFWEKVEAMLNSLRDKTTIGKDIVEDECEFAILKCTLLESIKTAKEVRSLSLCFNMSRCRCVVHQNWNKLFSLGA